MGKFDRQREFVCVCVCFVAALSMVLKQTTLLIYTKTLHWNLMLVPK